MMGLSIESRRGGREGANNTIFHVKMTIITFLLTLFDYMSIAFSKRVLR